MVSGGSLASASLTLAAATVTVQTVPTSRLLLGVSVKLVAGPLPVVLVKATGVPVGHSTANALAVTFTGSLKLTVIFAPTATPVAPVIGVVEVTVGAASVLNEKT